jgi:hypothetical protein
VDATRSRRDAARAASLSATDLCEIGAEAGVLTAIEAALSVAEKPAAAVPAATGFAPGTNTGVLAAALGIGVAGKSGGEPTAASAVIDIGGTFFDTRPSSCL